MTSKQPIKKNIGVLFGGESAEHDISVMSARSVYEAIDTEKYTPHLIGIDSSGHWHLIDEAGMQANNGTLPGDVVQNHSRGRLVIAHRQTGLAFTHDTITLPPLDALFPVTHGPKGEDGTIQGLLELMGIPYVGPGVLSSAVGMDKDVSKRLLRDAGIPVAEHITVRRHQQSEADVKSFGYPLFVKPANLGSSIGVSKVRNDKELLQAIERGFRHDRKIVIEKAIVGSEIECAVMGNESPIVSVPGKVIYQTDFYDYEAKYDESKGTALEIPARLPVKVQKRAQETAVQAYQALECEGMARVDMFVTPAGDVYVNEVNTLPGFTKYSMYPKLWEASGIPYKQLITRLIDGALE